MHDETTKFTDWVVRLCDFAHITLSDSDLSDSQPYWISKASLPDRRSRPHSGKGCVTSRTCFFLNLSLPASLHCHVSPGPFDSRHSPLLQPESPLLKREEENTTRQTARLVFKLAEGPTNPRQAETETSLRAKRRARRARNSQFKPQRLPGGQSRRRLERPTNHRPEGGASGRGAWPRVCALSPAFLP